jgi:predicted nucleic acid-binding protein
VGRGFIRDEGYQIMGILVDTSIWIDFFNGENSKGVVKLESAIEARIDICTCGVIVMEVLQGIRDDSKFKLVKEQLDGLVNLEITPSDYLLAANIYRKARVKGFTIRKSIDCIIASVAISNKVSLLHNDKDFDVIEMITTIKCA